MAIFGLVDNFIRIIAEEGGLWQFYLIRALMACMVIGSYCLCMRKKLLPKRVWAVALRSFPRIRGHFNLLLFSLGDANRGGGSDTIQFTHIPADIFGAVISHKSGSLAGRSGDSRVCWNDSGS